MEFFLDFRNNAVVTNYLITSEDTFRPITFELTNDKTTGKITHRITIIVKVEEETIDKVCRLNVIATQQFIVKRLDMKKKV